MTNDLLPGIEVEARGLRWELLVGQAHASPARGTSTDLDDTAYAKLCRALDDLGELTSAKAQDLLATDAAGARPYLNRLIEEGRAEKQGKARGTKYVLTNHRG